MKDPISGKQKLNKLNMVIILYPYYVQPSPVIKSMIRDGRGTRDLDDQFSIDSKAA